jgi:hypothetical protein
MLSHISLLHEVEEMQVGQLGTTIYDNDLKDREETQAENAKDQYE